MHVQGSELAIYMRSSACRLEFQRDGSSHFGSAIAMRPALAVRRLGTDTDNLESRKDVSPDCLFNDVVRKMFLVMFINRFRI